MSEHTVSVRLQAVGGDQFARAFDDAAAKAGEAMKSLASSAGPIGSFLTAMGPAGLVASAGIGLVTTAITAGLKEWAGYEQQLLKVEKILRATGNASGLTAKDIETFADQMESSSSASSKDVLQAAAALATFRTIGGEAFKDVIRAAQGYASVMGGDLAGTTQDIAKAFQNLTMGEVTGLSRSFAMLNPEIRRTIEELANTGRGGEAAKMFLEGLKDTFGDGGESGLTGRVKKFHDAWSNAFKEIGSIGWLNDVAKALIGVGQGAGQVVEWTVKYFKDVDSRTLENYKDELVAIANMLSAPASTLTKDQRSGLAARRQELFRQIDEIEQRMDAQASATVEEKIYARMAQDIEARDQAISLQRKHTETVEEFTNAQLRSIEVAKMGEQAREIALAQDRAELELTQKLAAVKQTPTDDETAAARARARAEILAKQETKGLAQLGKLDAKALDDEAKGDAEARQAMNDRIIKQREIVDGVRNEIEGNSKLIDALHVSTEAYEKQKAALDILNQYRAAGIAIGADEEKSAATLAEQLGRQRDEIKKLQDGYAESRRNAADFAHAISTGFEDAAIKGKGLRDVVAGLWEDFQRIIYRMMVTKPMETALTNSFSNFSLGSLFGSKHEGGMVGDSGPTRAVSPWVFAGAPRLHGGGLVAGERPIIALDNERVLTQAQQESTARTIEGLAAMAGRGGVNVSVNVQNAAPGAKASAQVTPNGRGDVQIDVMIEEVEARMGRNISLGRGLAPVIENTYGVNRAAGSYR